MTVKSVDMPTATNVPPGLGSIGAVAQSFLEEAFNDSMGAMIRDTSDLCWCSLAHRGINEVLST